MSNVDDSLKNESSKVVDGQKLSDKPRASTIEESSSKEVEGEVEEVVDDAKQGELVSGTLFCYSCHSFCFIADPITANDSITSEPRHPEGDEVVLEEVIPSVTANEDPPIAMDINSGLGGIVEMQGQKLNETVDLSVARKDIERESSDAVVTEATPVEVPGNPTGTSRVPSKRSTKSNTPLSNASKASLKSSSKNPSRTNSKHSRHGNEDMNTATAADNNGGNNSIVTGDDNTD